MYHEEAYLGSTYDPLLDLHGSDEFVACCMCHYLHQAVDHLFQYSFRAASVNSFRCVEETQPSRENDTWLFGSLFVIPNASPSNPATCQSVGKIKKCSAFCATVCWHPGRPGVIDTTRNFDDDILLIDWLDCHGEHSGYQIKDRPYQPDNRFSLCQETCSDRSERPECCAKSAAKHTQADSARSYMFSC